MKFFFKKPLEKLIKGLTGNLSIILFLLLWELFSRLGLINSNFIAAPSAILASIYELYKTGELFVHILISLQRASLGFLFAGLIGIPLGFILGGWFQTIESIFFPVLRFLGQFNPFSLFPIFIALFGIDELSKVVMIFWVSIWPVVFNTITGFKEVDPLIVKAARTMGLKKFQLFKKIFFPSALPYIFTGLKMSAGSSFFMLIAAEMIGASKGLGWLVLNAQTNYMIPRLFAATVLICILGLILNKTLKLIERRVINWKAAA
ncbi:MAG: ABC transporter permease [Clostridia bacterium]|nr:ABC transporter permease [Clostridia bacterium]